MGFLQEYQASNIVAQLKSQLATKAMVRRDGQTNEIESAKIVPGDIIHIEDGSIVPADGHVVSDDFIQVDQSSLTGESLAVEKKHGDEIFSSSLIKRGECLMIVTGTGDNTYVMFIALHPILSIDILHVIVVMLGGMQSCQLRRIREDTLPKC